MVASYTNSFKLMIRLLSLVCISVLVMSASCDKQKTKLDKAPTEKKVSDTAKEQDKTADKKTAPSKTELATFAGGCYWCLQPPFDALEGVISTTVGYMGGQKENPSYNEVARGETQHAEVIQIVFDPTVISYKELLKTFWLIHDPTTLNKSFNDEGEHYRSAIFYHSDEQKKMAEESKKEEAKNPFYKGKTIVTEITKASTYYKEIGIPKYQKFYLNDEAHYNRYKWGSGRGGYIERKKKFNKNQ